LRLGRLLVARALRARQALARRTAAERHDVVAAHRLLRRLLGRAVAVLVGRDLLARERVVGELLVDRRGDGLHRETGSLELREHVPRGHVALLGEFVYALLGHLESSLLGGLPHGGAERASP
jgi:hypothetical protein